MYATAIHPGSIAKQIKEHWTSCCLEGGSLPTALDKRVVPFDNQDKAVALNPDGSEQNHKPATHLKATPRADDPATAFNLLPSGPVRDQSAQLLVPHCSSPRSLSLQLIVCITSVPALLGRTCCIAGSSTVAHVLDTAYCWTRGQIAQVKCCRASACVVAVFRDRISNI